jgi:phosphatidylcholine synthase
MAYGVHVFTALGAALGFLALEAVIQGNLTLAFWWLGAALVVDAADGPMARRLNVSETASRYDGATLDLVVDFITYVFVPAAMLFRPEVMGQPWGLAGGLVITLGSALYFADTTMKTDDLWFRGFPAVWNVVVFYIVVFAPPTPVSFAIILALAALMFLPVIFVHPFRVKRWRVVTMLVLLAWAVATLAALRQNLQPAVWVKAVLVGAMLYFIFLGWLRSRRLPWTRTKAVA